MYVCIERELCFKELPCIIVGATGKSKIQRAGRQGLEVQVRIDVAVLNRMAGRPGRTSALQFEGKIPSLENLGLCS